MASTTSRPHRSKQAKAIAQLLYQAPCSQWNERVPQLIRLFPDFADEIKSRAIKASDIALDTSTNEQFLCSFYNEGPKGSFRSPWSNKYFTRDGTECTDTIKSALSASDRELEEALNATFKSYCRHHYLYYVSSVYVWNNAGELKAAFLVKKEQAINGPTGLIGAVADSISVGQIFKSDTHCNHQVRTDLIINIEAMSDDSEKDITQFCTALHASMDGPRFSIAAGAMPKNETQAQVHAKGLCQLIAQNEASIYNELGDVKFSHMLQVINSLRVPNRYDAAQQKELFEKMKAALLSHAPVVVNATVE